jgi:hypothetical protein
VARSSGILGRKGQQRQVPDEGDVDPEAAVDGGAVEAEEDAVGDGGPGGVLGVAVEAHLRGGGGGGGGGEASAERSSILMTRRMQQQQGVG